MEENFKMLGNAALMPLPKVAILSSRRVVPAAVMRYYDWATELRGGGRGATTLPVAATSAAAGVDARSFGREKGGRRSSGSRR